MDIFLSLYMKPFCIHTLHSDILCHVCMWGFACIFWNHALPRLLINLKGEHCRDGRFIRTVQKCRLWGLGGYHTWPLSGSPALLGAASICRPCAFPVDDNFPGCPSLLLALGHSSDLVAFLFHLKLQRLPSLPSPSWRICHLGYCSPSKTHLAWL